MLYPKLQELDTGREVVDVFKGYSHNLRIGDGEFYDMMNLTSNFYPVLSPRARRGVYAAPKAPAGLIAKDALCYVDGADFVMNEYHVEMGLSTADENCPKRLISMGAYVVIMPDKKYVNTLDLTDFGDIEASFVSDTDVTFELCTIDGDAYSDAIVSASAPEDPENLMLWIDTSSTPHTLKKFSGTSAMWVSIATTYIKISSAGIGKPFEQYDGVKISGVLSENLQNLNANMVIWAKDNDYIVVTGILDAVSTQLVEDGVVTVERKMPAMDFLIESGNRLWGCKYGIDDNGEVVNTIYACKFGDFKNWNCFPGISTDSYFVNVGSDGPFTGAVTLNGFPIFWKEGCLHKIYGDYPASFGVQTTACRGVQKGCDRSLAIVNEVLYYKAQHAVCAYDGSLPSEVSYAFGEERYSEAVGGSHGNKYYISMKDSAGQYQLMVYDTVKCMWHKEDNLRVDCFCSCREELYCIDHDSKKIITLLGSGTPDNQKVSWVAETGIIGTDMPDTKYVSRLTVRMSMELGTRVMFFAQYNSAGDWAHLGTVDGTHLRSFSLPVRPKRCDHFRLRIVGVGDAKIYSITKTIEKGSDVS